MSHAKGKNGDANVKSSQSQAGCGRDNNSKCKQAWLLTLRMMTHVGEHCWRGE